MSKVENHYSTRWLPSLMRVIHKQSVALPQNGGPRALPEQVLSSEHSCSRLLPPSALRVKAATGLFVRPLSSHESWSGINLSCETNRFLSLHSVPTQSGPLDPPCPFQSPSNLKSDTLIECPRVGLFRNQEMCLSEAMFLLPVFLPVGSDSMRVSADL